MTRALLLLAFAANLVTSAPSDCWLLQKRGKLGEAAACFQALTRGADAAEGHWGLHQYEEASRAFETTLRRAPNDVNVKVRFGRLLLERFNRAGALKLFTEALAADADHAGALLGAALVAAESFDRQAVDLAERAAKNDPGLAEARELLARLALEDGDPRKAAAEAQHALDISPESLEALSVLAAIELLRDAPSAAALVRIDSVNAACAPCDTVIARLLVLNRRYAEGIEWYRKAIRKDPEFMPARSELGINLMRVSSDTEARTQLEAAYAGRYRNDATVNSLRLLDSYKNFNTYRTPKTILRLHKKESELLHPYFEQEALRAIETYEKKYELTLPSPVTIEVYPDHEDFAVRTTGMPGLGALGVTFGLSIAMDSPSARKPGSFHWASTLWHELSHVFVLTATNHRVPRWFTEGMAVHEETAASPEWGDRLTPDILTAMQKRLLLPVAQLDRGFVRPAYPSQVIVSYFQAGRTCDYIRERWGREKLLAMMRAFSNVAETGEVVTAVLGVSAAQFDIDFESWLNKQHAGPLSHLKEWREAAARAAKAESPEAVIAAARPALDLYPEYVESGNLYEMLAAAHTARGDVEAAADVLARYAAAGGRNPAALKQLSTLEQKRGRAKEAAAALLRVNFIYPVQDEELHRRLGDLCEAAADWACALGEFRAVSASRPADPAAAHYQTARALRQLHRSEEAENELMLALEAAPGYRPAQKMLLELNATREKKE